MTRDKLSGHLLISSCVVALLLLGCASTTSSETADPAGSRLATTLKDIGGAPAVLAVSEPMRPFFAAGLGLIVLGGLTLCFGGGKTGLGLIALGAATTATGVLFVQYPWAVLLLALAAGLVAVVAVIDRWRTRRRLDEVSGELGKNREAWEATAEVIQNTPEGAAIKSGLTAMGREVEEKVRAVVDPIKDALRSAGRIR